MYIETGIVDVKEWIISILVFSSADYQTTERSDYAANGILIVYGSEIMVDLRKCTTLLGLPCKVQD